MPKQWNPNTGMAEEYEQPEDFITNIAEEAMDSDYERTVYIPKTWEERDKMAKFAEENPDSGVEIQDLHLPKSRIPEKPSDEKLSQWEKWDSFYKQVKPQIEAEAEAKADEAKSRVNRSYYGMLENSDIALMKPAQHAAISASAAQAYNSTYQHVLDKETSMAQTAFTRELERQERARIQQEAIDRRKKDTGWKRVDGPEGYQLNVRVKDGVEEVTPSDVPNQNRVIPPGEKPLEVSRVRKMATEAGQEPTATDIEAIDKAANLIGMEYKKVKTSTPGKIWGTNEKEEWQLVPKDKVAKELDKDTARVILKETGGDKDKARQLAKQRGYKF